MKTLFAVLISASIYFSYISRDKSESFGSESECSQEINLHCPQPPAFYQTIKDENKKNVSGSTSSEIDQNWYQNALEKIHNDEYKITYSEDLETYQSPNRKSNIRFVYYKNGFTAKNRTDKIPLFDLSNKSLSEKEKKYKTVDKWSIDIKLSNVNRQVTKMKDESTIAKHEINKDMSYTKLPVCYHFTSLEKSELKVSGNKASIENDNIRIEYTNNEKGMRQDFIIKNKPAGEGKLRLNLSADTKLRMIVGADALMFKDKKGNDKMKYSSLKVWDANGKELRAYFEKSSKPVSNYKLQVTNDGNTIAGEKTRNLKLETCNSFSIVVSDEDAVYPITIDPLSAAPVWIASGSQVEDHFGFSAATAGDVNGDGYSDVVIGAPEYDNSHSNGGRVYVYYGSAAGLSLTPNWTKDEISASLHNDRFGTSVATAGDVNGDGYSDLIVGAYTYTVTLPGQGRAFVYHGSAAGLSASANWSATVADQNGGFGYSVSTAGDINGDGYSDVIIGMPYSGTNFDAGTAYVYHGSSGGLNSSPNWQYTNIYSYGHLGNSVSTAGDVNGDGYSDVIIGTPFEPNGVSDAGKAIVFHGSASGLPASPNWTVLGNQVNQNLGICVSTAGDVNGDGYSDVIVGSWNYSNGQINEGRVSVYNGSSSGLSTNPNWIAESNREDAIMGLFASTAGDINGDGYGDIIVGAPQYSDDVEYIGKAFAWFGSSTGLGPNGTPANADWSAEDDLDFFGSCVATAGDVNGDGYSDVLVSSNVYPFDGESRIGRVFLYTGYQTGLSSTSAWSVESNQQDAYYGYCVSTAGDVNADGYSDVIVGAYLYDNGQTDEGAAFGYYGSATGLNTTANWISESNSANAHFGYSLSTAGDVNGDGFSDVVVGAPDWAGSGRVYVFHGSFIGLNSLWNYSLNADAGGDHFGASVSSAGDVNGDGYSDVIVGADKVSNGQSEEGKVYVFNGGSSGLNTLYSWSTESNQISARLGNSVATAGDVNGDGYSDVIAGAWTYDNGQNDEGIATVYYGSISGISGATMLEQNVASANFGSCVASAGDVNGDGYSDVIVGASSYSGPEFLEGAAYIFNGSTSGINTNPSWQIQSNQTLTNLGLSVASAGDVNGDGYSDVIVGAFNYDNGQTNEGRVLVYHGSQTGPNTNANWTIESNVSEANLGVSVSSAGDVNGDGYSDVIAGAYRFANGQTQEGKAFVYYGGGGSGNAKATVQQYSPLSSGVVSSGGLTLSNGQVKLALFGKSPFGRTKAKISHEYKTNGVPFSGNVISNGTGSTGTGNFTDLGISGTELSHSISGLQTGKLYKWRSRVQYSLAVSPYQKYGPWKYYNNYMPLPHGNFRPSNGLTLNKLLNLTMFIQGFYNSSSNTTVQDTVTFYIRNSSSPFAKIDSNKGVINSSGQASLNFTNVSNGVNYYLQIRHRNSVETWSKSAVTFVSGVLTYNFTDAANKAYGDNMIKVDASPVRYAVYNGDVNQDQTIDASDLSEVENAASLSLSGYVKTDITGDDYVDAEDLSIVENNSSNSVNAVTP